MKVKFRCVDCRQKYSFDADPGEEIRFRCRLCGAVQTFVVPEEPAEENPESTPAPAPAPAAPPPHGGSRAEAAGKAHGRLAVPRSRRPQCCHAPSSS